MLRRILFGHLATALLAIAALVLIVLCFGNPALAQVVAAPAAAPNVVQVQPFLHVVLMLVGIVVSNSILIVQFVITLREERMPLREAVGKASRVRLRPVLMTSLATVLGLIPMAMRLGTGSEAYAPLARAIIGGLVVSVY